MRVDAAHSVAAEDSAQRPAQKQPPALTVFDKNATAEQLRLHAEQLSAHLAARQKDLDCRESELHSLAARLESDARVARLWLGERESELAMRSAKIAQQQEHLAQLQQALEQRRSAMEAQARVLEQQNASSSGESPADAALLRRAHEALDDRRRQLDEAEARILTSQADIQRIQEELLIERRAFQAEVVATQRAMADEHANALAELTRQREAVQQRSAEVDHSHAAVRQLYEELERTQRETLETRLATEELCLKLAGDAPPATLTRSLARIRKRLAEHYQQAHAKLTEQRQELEKVRGQLAAQHEKLAAQKTQYEEWFTQQREESEQQASRLIAREQWLQREELQLREEANRWRSERLQCHQEIRRLRAQLATHEETGVLI